MKAHISRQICFELKFSLATEVYNEHAEGCNAFIIKVTDVEVLLWDVISMYYEGVIALGLLSGHAAQSRPVSKQPAATPASASH